MMSAEQAVLEVHRILADLGLDYAIIGGTAIQIWGEPRFTQDLDLTVLAPLEQFSQTVERLLARLSPRIDDAHRFAMQSRVLLVQTSAGYPVDISFGLPGYEEEVIDRVIEQEIAPGERVPFCSAEDLIIHKAVAGRVQDVIDIENIIIRQRGALDLAYIRNWLNEFSNLLETSAVIDRFEQAWRKYALNA
jgi:predicted nucleotidyltransferase